MKASEAINSNFIEHGDLDGKEAVLTVASYDKPNTVARADKSKIDKPVLRFEKTPKGMVLNKTNLRMIRLMYGNEMDAWVGKKITLYPTTTKMAKGAAQHVGCTILKDLGKMVVVACLRVKLDESQIETGEG